jgi:hypothetical protein
MRASAIHLGARLGAGLVVLLAACSPSAPTTAGHRLDVTIKDFKVVPSVVSADPGPVTFEVSNRGPTTHEVVVVEREDDAAASRRAAGGSGYGGSASTSSRGYGYGAGSDPTDAGEGAEGDAADGTLLPLGADGLSVDEDAIDVVDELEEVQDGSVGALSVSLEPGTYVLFCNLEGHYLAGMYATIEVA